MASTEFTVNFDCELLEEVEIFPKKALFDNDLRKVFVTFNFLKAQRSTRATKKRPLLVIISSLINQRTLMNDFIASNPKAVQHFPLFFKSRIFTNLFPKSHA